MFRPTFAVCRHGGEGFAPTLTASGDFDLACLDEFGEVLRSLVVDADEVNVDLRGVTYCDSSALRVLFTAATDAKLTLTIASAGPLRSLLRISGLDRLTTVNVID